MEANDKLYEVKGEGGLYKYSIGNMLLIEGLYQLIPVKAPSCNVDTQRNWFSLLQFSVL